MDVESLFSPMSQKEWNILLDEANQFVVMQGGVVLKEGEISNSVMILIEGDLEVCNRDGDSYHSIAIIKQGEVFGEISFFDNEPRTKSVIAKTDVVIGEITQALFSKFRVQHPHIATRFLIEASRNLAKRFRNI